MGGEITVESEPGHGSTFSFTIAAERAAMPTPALGASLAGKRVLVVDDNATSRLGLSEQVRALGAVPVEAATGRDAIDLARTERFDVALLDYRMPEMNGAELAAALRALPNGRMPIAMMSAIGERERFADVAPGLGLAALLTKPVKRSHLVRLLDTTLGDGAVPIGPVVEPPRPEIGLPHLRILVAEDNVVNQTVAIYLFEKLGYRIDVAKNGAEAVEAVRRHDYNVVFTDVQMPEMDGYEVTRWIRKSIPSERQPYIIAMTASAMDGDRERCLDAGMDDYVQKPIRPDALRAAIERMAR